MSILQEILKWSQDLPAWQQDAVRRLYHDRTLTDSDHEDLFALAKIEHGIPDAANRAPVPYATAQVAAAAVPNRLVQLTAIKNLRNVNALAAGKALPITADGLTIIYGENGAGKSGYSRVLKKACRARDQSEAILPNATQQGAAAVPPQASFDVIVNGVSSSLEWIGNQPSPEELSELAVFDSRCARAYVDNDGDFAYAPYGLDIIEGLVKACNKLKVMANNELLAFKADITPFADLARSPTKTGRALAAVSAKANPDIFVKLSALSDAETQRLAALTAALAEADPKQKAQTSRVLATRFAGLADKLTTAMAVVNSEKLVALQGLIEKSRSAKQAAELAAQSFKSTPGLLAGTGGEEWKALFEAARSFAAISHQGHDFPGLGAEAQCPLCQNKLGDEGSARLVAFDDFVQQAAERAAKAARASAKTAYKIIEEANLDVGIDEALNGELDAERPELASACSAMQAALNDRRQAAIKASAGSITWDSVAPMPTDPSEELRKAAERHIGKATALEQSMDEKAKAAMVEEHAELAARKCLAGLISTVQTAISNLAQTSKLTALIASLGTSTISRKSTELSKTMATQEVSDALTAELQCLNVHELKVVMKPESPGGKTTFKLALELPRGGAASAILSEGEQRAISIASFLAELRLGKSRSGVIFDDPVSSLDHRRRTKVAERLAQEALHRQVIVFTHDVYFLCVLEQEAEKTGKPAASQHIRKTADGFGVHTDRLPFGTLSTSKRVSALRGHADSVAQIQKAGDDETAARMIQVGYQDLRLAWERSVEEVLFQGVVSRFTEGVATNMLKQVAVEDSDFAAIDEGMTKCSKFAHDPAAAAQVAIPLLDEFRADIEKLETWRAATAARTKTIAARRK